MEFRTTKPVGADGKIFWNGVHDRGMRPRELGDDFLTEKMKQWLN
jgi:hypothetical protein